MVALGLMLLAWTSFAPGLENGFVNLDDTENFLENHAYRGFGPLQFIEAFGKARVSVYQPLNSLLWSAIYVGWGLDPRGYHLSSLMLHALNAAALLGVVLAVVARWQPGLAHARPGALLAGTSLAVAWFVAHPSRVEPVAWATAQQYVLCTLFALLSIAAYLRANPPAGISTRWGWRVGAYALSIGAMLCMPGAVSLPFLFLILDASLLRRVDLSEGTFSGGIRRLVGLVLEKWPILLSALAVMVVAYWSKRSNQATAGGAVDGIWARLAQVGFGSCYYSMKALFPFGIGSYHPRPERGDFSSPIFAASVAGLGVALAATIALRNRFRWLLPVSAAYLLVLMPHLGLIPVSATIASDRYAYLGSTILVVPLAAGLARLASSSWTTRVRAGSMVMVASFLVVLTFASREKTRIWHDSESLWAAALGDAPGSATAHAYRGVALAEAGKSAEALAEYDRALEIRPDGPDILVKRGATLATLGRIDEAIASDRAALAIRPDDPIAHLNLGIALALGRRYDEATASLAEAIARGPKLVPCRIKRGDVLLQQGKADEAASAYREAIELAPWDAQARTSLGTALAVKGDTAGAIESYVSALRESPRHVPALLNLGIALAQASRLQEAIAPLTEAAQLDPSNADAHHALGICCAGLGQIDSAVAECGEALRLDPGQAQARLFLEQARRK